jgi:L-seryl-tRNA(Ser) seleniumtransferase
VGGKGQPVGYNWIRRKSEEEHMTNRLRGLPGVDRVLSDRRVQRLVEEYSHSAVLELVRAQLGEARAAVEGGQSVPGLDELVSAVEERATSRWRSWPSPVINATGVILHTNLGRAPLSAEALEAVDRAARGYSDLELDLETGKRGSRQPYIARLICQLTGAGATLVVNNNASAVLLGLAAVAGGREVIVSRGEAVEIGGGFRIPDVLRQGGAELVEVGTTNRTYVRDYEAAISERTGALLSVHASNFRLTGFTHSPSLAELVELGKDAHVPVLHDLGSGCLLDTAAFGLAHEPMPQESVAAGVSLAFFSGDKLLGGPQAGVIVGEPELVGLVSRHPLARAVRIDKLSLAALSATLLHYVRDEATQKIPIWRMVSEPTEDLKSRANRWKKYLGPRSSVVKGLSTIGGGSLPGETLPTSLLSLGAGGAEALAARLRRGEPPVIGRIEDERVLLDPRTVLPEQDDALLKVVGRALSGPNHIVPGDRERGVRDAV